MKARLFSKFAVRSLLAVMILSVFALALPKPVLAVVPGISIVSVKADDTVTVRTHDFPRDVDFTIRMDKAGNLAIDGIVVGETNSGLGGDFEVTYRIPAELRGTKTIAIRMESEKGYYAFDWFNNRTSGSTTQPTPAPTTTPSTSRTPALTFVSVKANESVTVEARNLTPNTSYKVRVGPFASFSRDYVVAPSVTADASGFAKFTITLPDVVKNVELVTVRLDGGGRYGYNAFKNVDSGTTIPVTTTGICQVVSVTPGSALATGTDFDTVWTIKNISSQTWDGSSVDFKFVSGTKMQKRGDYFDLHQTVKPGETVKVTVDMVAPSSKGTYTTNWSLIQGTKTLCNLPLTLRVK